MSGGKHMSGDKGNGVVARIIFLDLGAGRVLSANPDGSDQKTLLFAEGNLTGIAYVELPAAETAIRPV